MWQLLACVGGSTDPTTTDVPESEHTAPTGDTGTIEAPTGDTAPPPPPPRCEPVATPTVPHVVEGEIAAFDLACTTGEDRSAFAVEVLLGPVGAAVDPATWRLTFPTDLDDAGTYELFVSFTTPGGVPENVALTVDVTDAGPGVPGNTPPDPLLYLREFGIPVIHLGPRDPVTQEYVRAPCAFDGVTYPEARMKIRGAASAGYPKPSYTLDFGEVSIDGDPLGMHDKRHLVLITTFDDNSYVRQKLLYDVWKDLAAARGLARPTIDTAFVVLYVGGQWQGLYVAADHVDDEFFEERGFNREGNVYKSVSHDANFQRTDANGGRKTDLSLGWEKKEGAPLDDFEDLEALTAWSADASPPLFEATADQWMVVDEFMDWYLLVSFTVSQDSAGKNAYLYDDPLLPRFRYVPWDFNHSWGQDWTTARVDVTTFDDYRWNNGIFAHFHDSPAMAETMWSAWEVAAAPGAPFDPAVLVAKVDGYLAAIDPEARRDWAQWQDDYRSYSLWSSRRDFTTYGEEVAYLRAWITDRGPAFEAARPHP